MCKDFSKQNFYLCSQMARVVVGLSGGVDSSVAAYLLKEQGHEVIGIFMKNWHDDSVTISNECPWLEDSNDALLIAQKLEIPFQTLDLSEEYRTRIVDYMFAEYESGRTPNPDVLCNREIKFDVFLSAAKKLKADFVATGHYCQKTEFTNVNGETIYQLIAGEDKNKDQSYFLCQLSQEQLKMALFPIGNLQKSKVREIATEAELITANKKDSQGLCFIGKVKLPDFLQQQLKPKKGEVIELPRNLDYEPKNDSIEAACEPYTLTKEMGKVVGNHNGAHFYTIGQRKGLGLGGFELPLFVLGINTKTNEIFVGQGEDHPALWRKGLFIQNTDNHWIREDLRLEIGQELRLKGRIRYRQDLFEMTLNQTEKGLFVVFDEKQKGVTPGQFAAFYQKNELIGSGIIG
jgi:tRNA-uridine 2-sulfurtransferase